jgi:3-deoxy-D-manno-octulosonic acid kinase
MWREAISWGRLIQGVTRRRLGTFAPTAYVRFHSGHKSVAYKVPNSDLNLVAPAQLRAGPERWRLRSAALANALTHVLSDPERVFAMTEAILFQSAMVTVARVEVPLAGQWLLRRYQYLKPSARNKDMLRPALVMRGFRLALALEEAGLPTPRVLAAGIRRKFWVPQTSYLLVAEVPEAVKLARFAASSSGANCRAVAAVAGVIARLHQKGFHHGDLTINNVLLDAQGAPWLIDLERASRKLAPLSWRWSVDDLHRFARHFARFSPAGQRSALRLLKSYLTMRGWSGREREFISAVATRLRGKEATAPVG